MQIYNTLTRKKEELPPPEEQKQLNMFVCGPTVYDYIHIGNARTFVFFDVVAKYLKYRGYDIGYIQNITDIDDKIINRAKQENKSWKEISEHYFEEFNKDTLALGINSPKYIKASNSIEEVKRQVKTLKSKGNVYLIENDGWYFDLKTFPEYGKLSGRTAEMANDAVSRIDENEKKRNKGDFCVWRLADKLETGYWDDDELGYGRPGWHIEDTAITEKEFGLQYDIHGGGQDLIFPHHEAEIAQQESASGLKPFVKYWMHVGFLVNKDEKMSKSAGNFETVNELLKKYSKETLRFYLLSGYYRSSLDYNEKLLNQSAAAVQRISEFKRALEITDQKGGGNIIKHNNSIVDIKESERVFFEALDNDFNSQEAFGYLFSLIRALNPPLRMGAISKEYAQPILEFLNKIGVIFGIISTNQKNIPHNIAKLVIKRGDLRQEEKWEDADKIRAQIEEMGYKVEDTIYGPLITQR